MSLQQAYRYCEWITHRHYENFPVASWLLPKDLRPHVAAVYAFARSADDFADESRYHGRSLELLDHWRNQLRACTNSHPCAHPIFLALADTIRRRDLPIQLLDDLLTAFRMDVTKRRYADWGELMTYCRYSANPVGRLVLLLFGIRDERFHARSDDICTALQLANHWQDLRIDLARDILYIPQDLMRSFGVSEADLQKYVIASDQRERSNLLVSSGRLLRRPYGPPRNDGFLDPQFQFLMKELVGRARGLFDSGAPLVDPLKGGLRLEIKLTLLGGRAILDRVEAVRYDVFNHRPVISTGAKIGLLARALF